MEQLPSSLDLNVLLAKYSQQQLLPADVASNATKQAPAPSRIQICPQCQGHRIERVPYGFMTMDRDCSKCDGEGVIQIKASEAPKPRIPTVQSA